MVNNVNKRVVTVLIFSKFRFFWLIAQFRFGCANNDILQYMGAVVGEWVDCNFESLFWKQYKESPYALFADKRCNQLSKTVAYPRRGGLMGRRGGQKPVTKKDSHVTKET